MELEILRGDMRYKRKQAYICGNLEMQKRKKIYFKKQRRIKEFEIKNINSIGPSNVHTIYEYTPK